VPLQYGMNLGAIFREYVWPHVLGAPDLKVVARAEHAAQTRGAASAASTLPTMASGGLGVEAQAAADDREAQGQGEDSLPDLLLATADRVVELRSESVCSECQIL
jgi:hypothetical protein